MFSISLDKKSEDLLNKNIWTIIHIDIYKNHSPKEYELTFYKKYPYIDAMTDLTIPTELLRLICDYTDEIILVKCSGGIYIYDDEIRFIFIINVNYQLHFIIQHDEVYTSMTLVLQKNPKSKNKHIILDNFIPLILFNNYMELLFNKKNYISQYTDLSSTNDTKKCNFKLNKKGYIKVSPVNKSVVYLCSYLLPSDEITHQIMTIKTIIDVIWNELDKYFRIDKYRDLNELLQKIDML